MQSQRKVIQIGDIIERGEKRKEVKEFLFGTDEYEFDEGGTDERLLCEEYFKNTSNITVFIGWIILIALIASLGVILLGWVIFKDVTHWLIGAAISLVVLFALNPLIKFFSQHKINKNYQFKLGFTQNFIIAAIAPKDYIEQVSISEVLQQGESESISEAYQEAKKISREKTLQNIENGTKAYHISRKAQLFYNKEYIVLTDGEDQMVLPYDKRAVKFLKTVALRSN